MALGNQKSTVNRQNMAVYVITRTRREEQDRPLQLGGIAPAGHRNPPAERFVALWVFLQRSSRLGMEVARCDGIDVHPEFPPLARQPLRKPGNRRLRRRICYHAGP